MYAAQSFSMLRKKQFKEIIKITMTFMFMTRIYKLAADAELI